ncbi:MAG: 16S rRNA (adenine(1518)-N(6)/adenine(1519)-N(6))-dimethyltransferase RsmA [Gammaproteobacteria bacterium]|jgi:16S rRNA (adenine1518-N6/adenine1519-N6)-dimethyltransferase|nr:16S rRNA (adenine(1518)-N(6)/adenine(1519)-N(6))-dimethyltransferase RsmA [Gammaproteobacteria bacterium]MDH3907705.1 16S rRNA (adenine(1518)-N(6)/adenine(1519)-N(6))-dimethyltransferase RsmA [Gammaproteobacteria bacterium]MDH3984749.1 16S rRNA (adenine(1518)-N(6)/adenine(1519)-N(6))-dimethyltransferase RsmA [Gammaproteobacteria bacterium]
MAKHRARKRFGQHFLSDPGIIDAIVRAVHPTADDVIVEIGPGQGAITDALARSAGHLHAVELDRDLVARLRRRYEDNPNVTVHEADALQFDFASLGDRIRVVGNLPYNISTPLLFHLLKFRSRILDMHFMLQKEVVDRMAASPGSKAYGRLGIMLGCHLNIESLFDVPREAFDPPPEVTSAVVRLDPLPPGTFDIQDEAGLSTLVSTAFMQRRKTLRNSLKKSVEAIDFEAVGIDASQRPEQISIGDYVRLSNHLRQKSR